MARLGCAVTGDVTRCAASCQCGYTQLPVGMARLTLAATGARAKRSKKRPLLVEGLSLTCSGYACVDM
jgi:hypothetical protein